MMDVLTTVTVKAQDVEAMDTNEEVPVFSASTENGLLELNQDESKIIIDATDNECVVINSSVVAENGNVDNILLKASVITISDEGAANTPKVNAPTSEQMINYLLATRKKKCEEVETAALDFITELHHPVVSCFREISKADINVVFNNARFRSESSEFEQAVTCITFMDYIAASLKNPLYSETFSKSEISIRPCVKKVFLEIRRLLKDWAAKDSTTFVSGKRMIVKFLRGLTPFFKSIQYDKAYKSAVDLLEKDAARAQRAANKSNSNVNNQSVTNTFDRSALVEITSNAPNTEDKQENGSKTQAADTEHDLSDDIFDVLDDVPLKKKPAPVFLKSKSSNSARQTTLNWFKPKLASKVSNPENNNNQDSVSSLTASHKSLPKSTSKTEKIINRTTTDSVAQKRPADSDFEMIESPPKKLCVMNGISDKSEHISGSNSTKPSSTPGNILPSPVLAAPSEEKSSSSKSENSVPIPIETNKSETTDVPEPPKQKMNAFAFLMNRSREVAKEKQIKKQQKQANSKTTPTVAVTPKSCPTVKAIN